MPEPSRKPGYGALRKGRVSIAGAHYFLTVTLQRPLPRGSQGLSGAQIRDTINDHAMVLETWKLRAMVIMPDHIHLLVGLEAKSVSDSVRIFKGRLSPKLRKHNLKWQSGFYDHRLRPKDKLSGVVRYMWLNPYRAGICNEGEAWPGWWCDEAVTG